MHRYRVTALYGGKEYMLHDALSTEQIYDDELKEEAGKSSSFSFSLPPDHENLAVIEPLQTRILIYDNGVEIWDGRVISDERDIINTGTIQAAGAMSYLTDSQQEPEAYTGGINAFLDLVLSKHNEQSEMQFSRGEVTVVDKNDYINRSWSDYYDTLSLLEDKLVKTHGGYLRVRHQTGNHYLLDYLSGYGSNAQIVRLGENLQDITSQRDASDVFTRLIPLGAEIESEQETDIKQYTTIETVNGGKKYIENAELKARYGTITRVQNWDDVTLPQNLLTKAQAYLAAAILPRSFSVDIIDLSIIDEDTEPFEIGKMTTVSVPSQGVELQYMLTGRTKHLTAPQNDSITLGPVQQTITQTQISEKKDTQAQITQTQIDASNHTINTGKSITGAKGGYVVIDAYDDSGKLVKPWRILIMDSEDKKSAQNVIQLNVNGIGFSTTGIDGPYRNAWTIDGILSADFIRTGTLTLGGKTYNSDGAIVVLDANDKEIGRWDKDGLKIKKGSIEGTTIKVGPFEVDDDGVHLGDFEVSTNGENEFRSSNNLFYVIADTKPTGSVWAELHIKQENSDLETMINPMIVSTYDFYSSRLKDKYGQSWESVGHNIEHLWDQMDDALNRIKYLEDNMDSGGET